MMKCERYEGRSALPRRTWAGQVTSTGQSGPGRQAGPAKRRGAALAMALVTLLVVSLIAAAVVRSALAAHRHSRQRQDELQAQWLAECAIGRAAARLALDSDYEGETWQPAVGPSGSGVATIAVTRDEDASDRVRVAVEARFPDHEWRRVAVSRTYDIPIQP